MNLILIQLGYTVTPTSRQDVVRAEWAGTGVFARMVELGLQHPPGRQRP